jgi:hypothetical protein
MGGDLETESNKVTLYSFGSYFVLIWCFFPSFPSVCVHVLNFVCELAVFVTDHFDVIDWS